MTERDEEDFIKIIEAWDFSMPLTWSNIVSEYAKSVCLKVDDVWQWRTVSKRHSIKLSYFSVKAEDGKWNNHTESESGGISEQEWEFSLLSKKYENLLQRHNHLINNVAKTAALTDKFLFMPPSDVKNK